MLSHLQKLTPYLSLGFIETTKHVENLTMLKEISLSTFQFLIAGLTVLKLLKDLKDRNKKTK